MFKKLFILNFFILFISLPFIKVHSIEADIFVQSTVNRAAETLGGNLTKEERIEELKKIALDTVDITGIGFYSLGAHRKSLSDEKKLIKLLKKKLSNVSFTKKIIWPIPSFFNKDKVKYIKLKRDSKINFQEKFGIFLAYTYSATCYGTK